MRDFADLNDWSDDILKGEKPPPGFTPVPGSKVGLWHKKTPSGWDYWKPANPPSDDVSSIARKLSPSAARLLVVAVASPISSGFTGRSKNAPQALFYPAPGRGSRDGYDAKASRTERNKLIQLGLIGFEGERQHTEWGYKNWGQHVHHMSSHDFTYHITDKGRAVAAELAKLHADLREIHDAAIDKVHRDERERDIDKTPATTAWRALNGLSSSEFSKTYPQLRAVLRAGAEDVGPQAVAVFNTLDADPRPDNPARSELHKLLIPEPFQRD